MFSLLTPVDHPAAPRRRWTRTRPRLEALEDRRLLATFNPLPSAADGSTGSLRAAIIQANANGQDNTINLDVGTYPLTITNTAGHESAATQGDLNLTGVGHTITIQGKGAGVSVIDGGFHDRVFQIASGVKAVLSGLTIADGKAQDGGVDGALPGTQDALGGGILNDGTAVLDGVEITQCFAKGGSGKAGTPGGLTAAGGGGFSAAGGGIYNSGTMTLTRSLVDFNDAVGGDGGKGSSSGDPNGTGGAGGAGSGGGIFNAGSLTVTQSTIENNSATGGVGGAGGVNTVGFGPVGGRGGDGLGGGLFVSDLARQTLLINSTITGNDARGGNGGMGGTGGSHGGIVPGETGGQGGNGGVAKGGAIDALTPFSLDNCTVAGNKADGSSGGLGGLGGIGIPPGSPGVNGFTGPAFAGGIYAPSDPGTAGLVTSISTIIALNTSGPFGKTGTPDDLEATFANVSHTLLGVGDGALGISNGSAGNLVGVDPKLDTLKNNGGPTPTLALLPGSPAINAGSNPLNLTADQRGYTPRAAGGAPDIGAFEFGATAPPPGTGGGGGSGGGGSSHGPPKIVNAQVLFQTVNVGRPHKGHVKTRRQFVGFELTFNEALDPARAQDPTNYAVLATSRHGRKTVTQPVGLQASYNASTFAVDLVLAGQQAFPKGGRLTVNGAAPGGLADPAGDLLVGTTSFTILPKASGLA